MSTAGCSGGCVSPFGLDVPAPAAAQQCQRITTDSILVGVIEVCAMLLVADGRWPSLSGKWQRER